jgi:flagellar hook assembly protein FlgD
LQFSLQENPSRVHIEVVEISGRRVRALLDRELTQGTHIVGWDGKNDNGKYVAAGTYFAKLSVNGREVQTKRMTVLR